MMIKLKRLIFVGLLAVLMGCNDAIDITQPGQLLPENAFQSVDDLRSGLLGLLAEVDTTQEIALSSNFTDEIAVGFDSGGQGFALYDFVLTPASAASSNFWIRNFRVNNRATVLIEASGVIDVDPADQAEFNNILGQIYFIRAWANFEMLTYFSPDIRNDDSLGVPVIDFVAPLGIQPRRNTTGECWDYINADMALAQQLIGPGGGDVTFVTGDAVNAMRARMAMTRGNYGEAAALAQSLLNAYPLAQRDDYQDMFLDFGNDEIIFKLERTNNDPFDGQGATGSVNAGGWAGARFAFVDATLAGSPYFEMDRTIFDRLDPADIRYDVMVSPTSIISPDYENDPDPINNDILVIQKYFGSEGQPLMNDLKVFRSSEMLFILAEARAVNNDLAGAANLIADLRTARFGSTQPAPSFGTQADAFRGILEERRIELAFEGHRMKDLKRLGPAAGVGIDRDPIACELQGGACTLPSTDFRFTLPIPIAEINANPGIAEQQNPGY